MNASSAQSAIAPRTPISARIRRAWTDRLDETLLFTPTGAPVPAREFFAVVDRWRHALRGADLRAGSIVGVALPRSVGQVAALVAIHESDLAYVPLDPNYPSARLAFMASDLAVTHVLRGPMHETPALPGVAWVDLAPKTQDCPGDPVIPKESSLAYVIYTSGSTGKPKGVRITHDNLATFCDSWDSLVTPEVRGRWLALTSLSFDPSVVELLWTLSRGWTITLAPDRPAPGQIGELIEATGVTHLQCTPTRATMLLAEPEDVKGLKSLDEIFVGGEVLTAALARKLGDLVPEVVNIYGPTETTVWAFAHRVLSRASNVTETDDPIPVGRPLQGVTAFVVAEDATILPDGEVGEIVLAGDDVAAGYHDRPDRNAVHFVRHVIDGVEQACYHTGDLGRRRPDGVWDFLGRADNQIKISGNRIEPAEIETVLLSNPSVRLAAVVARELAAGAPRLVAFIQPVAGRTIDIETLRAACQSQLPNSHVPAVFVVEQQLPMTPSGKVDRGVLPTPVAPASEDGVDVLSDSSDRLTALCRIWSAVLGHGVRPDDDYFVLGGDSLGAVAILADVASMFGRQLGLAVLIDAPTPRRLLEHIDTGAGHQGTMVALRTVNDPKRKLFIVHGAGGNIVNFVHLARPLPPDVDVYGFQASGVTGPDGSIDRTLDEMVERYLAELRSAHPEGPYLLAGYSDGGLVAWEMARRLLRDGAVVPSVLLIDTAIASNPVQSRKDFPRNILRNIRDRQRPLAAYLRDALIGHRQPTTELNADADDMARLATIDVQAETEIATSGYKVPPLSINVDLIRSRHATPLLWHDFRWDRHTSGHFRVRFSSGDHLAMLLPANTDELARHIAGLLPPLH